MQEKDLEEFIIHTISKQKWERLAVKRRAGVAVPLFSVYSSKSVGIGEFDDIRLLIDWCKESGNSTIQLMPLNEVGAVFCPYDSISSFAMEPAYISLRLLPCKQQALIDEEIIRLNKLYPSGSTYVNYAIKKEKTGLLWEIFNKGTVCEIEDLRKFIDDNYYWIHDFALYKVLKDYHESRPWYDWPEGFKNRNAPELEAFRQAHERELNFQIWLQWQLYRQFKEIKLYAQAQKVIIKGDMPILVSRDSADVWAHPEFFKLEFAAGAPPDMYCSKGQRWGMPTYNWEKIESDGYRYLKSKLKYAENFYDILRIDHVVGLFRIWSIPFNEPAENQGLHGFFDPHDEHKWKEHGRKILSVIIGSTNMLLCAEDLGIIPQVCRDTLKELGIPGNDVQRWTKDWSIRHDFLTPQEYRGLSVSMLSTHDTTNWPAWWENEAGTVDEALFIRKCGERHIDYNHVKGKLFEPNLSGRGRLRWLNSVDSVDAYAHDLGKKKEELGDFIDMYVNTFHEKEKLWKLLQLSGPMREKWDIEIMRAILKFSLSSRSIFCIELILDWLFLTGIFKGDPYQYRINMPGTVNEKNWSMTIPLSLEELINHRVNKEIKELILSSGR